MTPAMATGTTTLIIAKDTLMVDDITISMQIVVDDWNPKLKLFC